MGRWNELSTLIDFNSDFFSELHENWRQKKCTVNYFQHKSYGGDNPGFSSSKYHKLDESVCLRHNTDLKVNFS